MVDHREKSSLLVKLTECEKYNLQSSSEIKVISFEKKLFSQMCRNLIFLDATEERMFGGSQVSN